MDEAKLKEILSEFEVPTADENAKKRAVNLALAEFKTSENKRKNESQGNSLWARLIGKTTQTRRDPMAQVSKRRLMYGGMATAMAVVLIAGVSFTQLQTVNTVLDPSYVSGGSEIVAPPGTEDANPAYIAAIEEHTLTKNLNAAPAEQMAMADSSAAPTAPPAANFSNLAGNIASSPAKTKPSGLNDIYGESQAKVARQDFAAGSPPAAQMAESDASRSMYAPAPPGVIYPHPVPLPEPVDNYYQDEGRDKFKDFQPSPVKLVATEPVSTFSIDVDTASYSVVRRQLNMGAVPNPDAIRIEEMVNYFDYSYPLPETREQPFKPSVTVVPSPWNNGKKIVHIGIKGFDVQTDVKPQSNLVFLVDVSGSMDSPDKLPLVKASLKMLLDQLQPNDTVALTVYAGSAGTVLEPTKVSDKAKILSAIDNLSAGGSTAGAAGINEAYRLAEQNFNKEGVNRVIIASDGDFNVGASSDEELKTIIEKKRESGIFLSVLGFGMGNLNDSLMQTIAQNGNGTASYIDNLSEARKVLVDEASSTLFPIARDVKIQVEFNPALVQEYRLVGYETRALNREDFNNDKIDAGDIGAGHAVTAIYEITPVGQQATIDPSRYAKPAEPKPTDSDFANEIGFLKMRYKLPNGTESKLITTPISEATNARDVDHKDIDWAITVAGFGQLLKGDSHIQSSYTYDTVIEHANESKGADAFGERAEFINLVRLAKSSAPQ